MLARALLIAAALAALAAGQARASEPLTDTNLQNVTLQVNAKGIALVSYARANGQRHVLVWGAINALAPNPDIPQVKFKWDYSGGWKSQHNPRYWKTFDNACQAYDGPPLVDVVATCKAPDGSYWAVQAWQRKLPHRGFQPSTGGQTAVSFDVSHWSGSVATLELYVDWPKTFNYETEQIFGRLTYQGQPVHGFHTTANGIPTDAYGRGLYIDTLDSAYGAGWKRETSIVFRNPTGSFCYAFYPTHDVSLPGQPLRPAGVGAKYRITTIGPGVTPDLQAQVDGIGKYDGGSGQDAALEQRQLDLYDQITNGDKFCATQR
jgi:hypothetical protein